MSAPTNEARAKAIACREHDRETGLTMLEPAPWIIRAMLALANEARPAETGEARDFYARTLFARREPDTPWDIALQHGEFSDIAAVRDGCFADADAILAAVTDKTVDEA